jgi:MoaA/NifB/PqqE/SkfB family radical SAM enzyme
MAERLVAAQNYEVVVSIETTNPERYADIRRNGTIECFIENLERLNRAKQRAGSAYPKITACCILMKHTLDDIPDLVAMLKKNSVVKMHTADMCTYPEYAGPLTLADGSDLRDQALSATMTEEEIWAALAKIKALGDESIEVTVPGDWGGLKIEHADDGVILTCLDLWRLPFIKANSEMATCCWAPQLVMGNFNTQTFDEIWFGRAYRNMRLSHLTNRAPEQCLRCQQRFYAVAVPSTLLKKRDPRFTTREPFL